MSTLLGDAFLNKVNFSFLIYSVENTDANISKFEL